jgi:hypothetical protein
MAVSVNPASKPIPVQSVRLTTRRWSPALNGASHQVPFHLQRPTPPKLRARDLAAYGILSAKAAHDISPYNMRKPDTPMQSFRQLLAKKGKLPVPTLVLVPGSRCRDPRLTQWPGR